MSGFIARRLGEAVVVILIASFAAFSIVHLLPGDPARVILGSDVSQEQIDRLRSELWLDRPLLVQYARWLFEVIQGNLGISLASRLEIRDLIGAALPVTLQVGALAMVFSLLVGIPIGVLSAVKRGTWLDGTISLITYLGTAMPIFWLGLVGIYVFGLQLRLLPIQGYTSPLVDPVMSFKQMLMPAILLALVPLASLARQMRSSLLEVINQDYVRTARAKGLWSALVIRRHAIPNALIPVVTLLGIQTRNLVGGSLLVETVFNIPGMGRLLVQGVFGKDFVVVQGVVLVVTIVVVIANLLVDISYGYLDPRIKSE
jgi:peptide/nickel transport system permease protein